MLDKFKFIQKNNGDFSLLVFVQHKAQTTCFRTPFKGILKGIQIFK